MNRDQREQGDTQGEKPRDVIIMGLQKVRRMDGDLRVNLESSNAANPGLEMHVHTGKKASRKTCEAAMTRYWSWIRVELEQSPQSTNNSHQSRVTQGELPKRYCRTSSTAAKYDKRERSSSTTNIII
jgi:hypothetical protein